MMKNSEEVNISPFLQLWKEYYSTQKSFPYSFNDVGESRFSIIKTLMNMIILSFDKIESEMSPSMNQSKRICKTCPMLRDQLLEREQRLCEVREECRNLSMKFQAEKESLDQDTKKEIKSSLLTTSINYSRTPFTPIRKNQQGQDNKKISSPFASSPVERKSRKNLKENSYFHDQNAEIVDENSLLSPIVIRSTMRKSPYRTPSPNRIRNTDNKRVRRALLLSQPSPVRITNQTEVDSIAVELQSSLISDINLDKSIELFSATPSGRHSECEMEVSEKTVTVMPDEALTRNKIHSTPFSPDAVNNLEAGISGTVEPSFGIISQRSDPPEEVKAIELNSTRSQSIISAEIYSKNIRQDDVDLDSDFKSLPTARKASGHQELKDGWIGAGRKTNTKNSSAHNSKVKVVHFDPSRKLPVEPQVVDSRNKRQFKQTTLVKSFGNAKNRLPVKTVDLSTLHGFEGGQRNGAENSNVKSKRNQESAGVFTSVDNLGLRLIDNSKKLKVAQTEVDADETFFNPSLEIYGSTSRKNDASIAAPVLPEYGDATLEMIQNFNKIPKTGPPSPKYAYKPEKAIRKKEERAKLPGWDCDMCRKYYEATRPDLNEEEMQNYKNKCSKHRSRHPVNLDGTPPNFWDVDFPSTEECIAKGFLGQGLQSPR